MGKMISQTLSRAGGRWGSVVLALLACLVIAACAQRDRGADDEKRPGGGFYGGVSGGM